MNISSLINKHPGSTIYIVGSGPSLRFFPPQFLENELTISLNLAYKNLPFIPTYNLTIHPELIDKETWMNYNWITKAKNWLNKPTKKHVEHIYFFKNNKEVTDMSYVYNPLVAAREGRLYVGRGIHTAASILGAVMGAETCVLVGVDLGATGGDHHVTSQSVRFHGMPPAGVYREYYLNLRLIRSILKEKFCCNLLTLSPFLGLHHVNEDYKHLEKEFGCDPLVAPMDISTYKRRSFDFT